DALGPGGRPAAVVGAAPQAARLRPRDGAGGARAAGPRGVAAPPPARRQPRRRALRRERPQPEGLPAPGAARPVHAPGRARLHAAADPPRRPGIAARGRMGRRAAGPPTVLRIVP